MTTITQAAYLNSLLSKPTSAFASPTGSAEEFTTYHAVGNLRLEDYLQFKSCGGYCIHSFELTPAGVKVFDENKDPACGRPSLAEQIAVVVKFFARNKLQELQQS